MSERQRHQQQPRNLQFTLTLRIYPRLANAPHSAIIAGIAMYKVHPALPRAGHPSSSLRLNLRRVSAPPPRAPSPAYPHALLPAPLRAVSANTRSYLPSPYGVPSRGAPPRPSCARPSILRRATLRERQVLLWLIVEQREAFIPTEEMPWLQRSVAHFGGHALNHARCESLDHIDLSPYPRNRQIRLPHDQQ